MVSMNDVHRTMQLSALTEIAERHGGRLAPVNVVDAARVPTHPLHDYFEWDDAIAGEGYRLAQAAMLIRRIKFTLVKRDGQGEQRLTIAVEQRAFESSPPDRVRDGQSYMPIEVILNDPVRRAALVMAALAELRAIQKRYQQLDELVAVWRALDTLT